MEAPATPSTTVETRAPRLRPWTVFRSGPYRKLWLAFTLSVFGDFFNYIAMAWLGLPLTGSRLALGGGLMGSTVPRGFALSGRRRPGGWVLARLYRRLAEGVRGVSLA